MAKKNSQQNETDKVDESRLREILLSGNLENAIVFFENLPEERSKNHADFCLRWSRGLWVYAEEHDVRNDRVLNDKAKKINPRWGAYSLLAAVSTVAVLATCDVASIRIEAKNRRVYFYGHTSYVGRVIRNRPQKTISDIIEIAFGPGSIVGKDYWLLYRSFVRDGVLEPIYSDFATRMMFESMVMDSTAYPGCSQMSVTEQLEANPDLLEEAVWKIFEARDFPAKWSYTDIDSQHGWKNAIMELIVKGRIDKQRVLDSCFKSITGSWTDHRLRWFVQLLERIPLDKNELKSVHSSFLDLLYHAQPTPRALGLSTLERCFKEGLVHDKVVIDFLPIILREPSKAKAKKGIAMMEKIVKRSPELLPDVLPMAVDVLLHEQSDIQQAAAKFLLQNGDKLDSSLQNRINEHANQTTASVREILLPLVASLSSSSKTSKIPVETTSKPAKTNSIPEPIVPIGSVEELIDAVLRFLSTEGRVEEMERIIDGIVRFHEERDGDFEERTKVIRKKFVDAYQPYLEEILCFWLIRREKKPDGSLLLDDSDELFTRFNRPMTSYERSKPFVLLVLRSAFWIADFQKGKGRILLSTPTHKSCLIDPLILVDRLDTLSHPFLEHESLDLLLSILRLGKWNVKETVLELREKNPKEDLKEYYDAVAYALGDDTVEIGSDPALWAAASRSRDPMAVDHRLLEKHPQLGYGTARPPEGKELIEFVSESTESRYNSGFVPSWERKFQSPSPSTDYPTAVLYKQDLVDSDTPLILGILFSFWPNNPRLFYHKAAAMMMGRSNRNSYVENGMYPFEVLIDRSEPLHEEGALLLAAGLVQSQANVCGIATDAAIQAISRGRLDFEAYIKGCDEILRFVNLAKTDEQIAYFASKVSRWAKPFKTISQESAKHTVFIRDVLDSLLSKLPARDLGPYLELFYELCVGTTWKDFSEETSNLLSGLTGTGKATKLAKKLLEIK